MMLDLKSTSSGILPGMTQIGKEDQQMPFSENSALQTVLNAVLLGGGATLFMDLVAVARHRLFGVKGLEYALVGRWLGHLPQGVLLHRPISRSAPIWAERAIGWGAHYAIGIMFAGLFLAIVPSTWLAAPALWPSLAFGLGTVTVPFFLLQPCLGAGVAASKTPHPWRARYQSAIAHLTFGLGLWGTGWAAVLAAG